MIVDWKPRYKLEPCGNHSWHALSSGEVIGTIHQRGKDKYSHDINHELHPTPEAAAAALITCLMERQLLYNKFDPDKPNHVRQFEIETRLAELQPKLDNYEEEARRCDSRIEDIERERSEFEDLAHKIRNEITSLYAELEEIFDEEAPCIW